MWPVKERPSMQLTRYTLIQIVAYQLILLSAIGCSNTTVEYKDLTQRDKAHAHLKQRIADQEFPGVQYMVLDKQGVIFEFNGGQREVASNAPVTAETTFMSSSSTKVMTALAVLQLVDRGLVSLDEPLSSYFKDHSYGDALTVHQLVIHTAGVPNPLPLDWFHPAAQHDEYDENAELEQRLKTSPRLESTPGTVYEYSNLGYWLLSKVIETAAKTPCCDYVRQNILEPLDIGPKDLGYTVSVPKNHAAGYIKRFSVMRGLLWFMAPSFLFSKNEGAWTRFQTLYMNGPAYGGLIGTARGWSRFLMDQLEENSKVMSPNIRRLFYEIQHTTDGNPIGMTLGWHTGVLGGHGYYYKAGGGPGYSSNIRIYPKKGMASVWLNNKTGVTESPIQELSDAIDSYFVR
jgi:CubicO group peptidase (beta-lactamase class C family)